MRALRLLLATVATAGLAIGQLHAAELKVLSAAAMRAPVQELAPAFEAASGHKLKIQYDTVGEIGKKIAADEEIDVAILTQPVMNKLVREAKMVGGSTKVLARAEIAVAVKKGAAKPDISSPDALKQSLLKAKSLAYVDPASGAAVGSHIAKTIEKLGIADALKPKTRLLQASGAQSMPPLGEALLKGEAEVGLGPMSTLIGIEGIEIVGALPDELQSPDLLFAAGSPYASEQPLPAKAFIDFLAGTKAKEVYKAKGLGPAPSGPG